MFYALVSAGIRNSSVSVRYSHQFIKRVSSSKEGKSRKAERLFFSPLCFQGCLHFKQILYIVQSVINNSGNKTVLVTVASDQFQLWSYHIMIIWFSSSMVKLYWKGKTAVISSVEIVATAILEWEAHCAINGKTDVNGQRCKLVWFNAVKFPCFIVIVFRIEKHSFTVRTACAKVSVRGVQYV